MMHVGADDEGGGSRLWLGRPKDGSAVLDLREQESESGQWALRDQEGNAVVAEGPDGVGLARPVMPVATHWIVDDPDSWFLWNRDFWGPVIYAWAVFQHTAVTFYFKTRGTYGGGDVRFLVDGELIDTRPVEEGRTRTERFEVDGRRFLNFDGPVRVELQGRCQNDPGAMRVAPFYNEGAGTPPAPPE
ncbi:hypothetical protein [Nocardiopsis baichengensis]|uniref:hypothetical protein n=1 Tax=Nocardiopsis baichengensis TaxID=280240 RepID=UPI00034CC95D|nr:hypothetical protein [Nocardiopsis baichengensis]